MDAVARNVGAVDVFANAISKSKRQVKFKNDKSIKRSLPRKLKQYTVHIHKTTGKTKIQNFAFPKVLDRPEKRELNIDNGLMINKHNILEPLNHPVNKKYIKRDLLLINTLIKSYDKYAYHTNSEYDSRPIEAILYGLTSVFLGEIRNQITPGLIRDVPLFFFIGGARKTGKTSLLKFIMKLLGFYPVDTVGLPIVKRYADMPLTGSGNIGRKTGVINTIHDIMSSEFVTPLMINEIDDTFNYQKKGTNLIVRTMGEFQDHSDW